MSFKFNSTISIAGRNIGPGQPVFVVAEAGVAHFGSLEKAFQLVDMAHKAGADAVKFQAFRTEELVGSQSPEWRRRLASRELPLKAFEEIADYCRQVGITFFATAHDEVSLNFLHKMEMPVYKIGSGEVTNWPFIEHVAGLGRPVMISTGMYSQKELAALRQALVKVGNPDIAILHCVTRYPTPAEDVDLAAMDHLAETFKTVTGYSDHTKGFHIPLAAVARGACIIEKHISLDFDVPDAQDWKVSCGPENLAEMVSQIREVEAAISNPARSISAEEAQSREWARKSLVAKINIPAGTVIDKSMLAAKRPGTGISPDHLPEILGRCTTTAILADSQIGWEQVEAPTD
jgi:N,N'-diacetyllegionaminate synthase